MKIEIVTKEIYRCPICGKTHDNMESAEKCVKMGEWLENFQEKDYLWRWNIIFRGENDPCSATLYATAIIPCEINKSYTWTASRVSCMGRPISLFNSFSNSYIDIYRSPMVVGFVEAFEKYGFLPPVKYMKGMIPEKEAGEMRAALELAFKKRIRELSDSGLKSDDFQKMVPAMEFADFATPIKTGKGELSPVFSLGQAFPKTSIINGEDLFYIKGALYDKILADYQAKNIGE